MNSDQFSHSGISASQPPRSGNQTEGSKGGLQQAVPSPSSPRPPSRRSAKQSKPLRRLPQKPARRQKGF
jgi:hypothetical protein